MNKLLVKDFNLEISGIYINLIKELNNYDFKVYITGGAIRNKLLGYNYTDIDIACIGRTKEEFKEEFRDKIVADFDNVLIYTKNYMNFFAISFSNTIEEDFYTRDYTINSFMYDAMNKKIYGKAIAFEDIENKILRPCNESNLTLITTLRGIRLSNTYKLKPLNNSILSTKTGVATKIFSLRLKNELSKHTSSLPSDLENLCLDLL